MSIPSLIRQHGTRCRVSRPTHSQDVLGGAKQTFATVEPHARFKIDVQSGTEAVRYRRESGRNFARLYAMPDSDVRRIDKVIPLEGDFEGREFDVQTVFRKGGPMRRLRYLSIEAEVTL